MHRPEWAECGISARLRADQFDDLTSIAPQMQHHDHVVHPLGAGCVPGIPGRFVAERAGHAAMEGWPRAGSSDSGSVIVHGADLRACLRWNQRVTVLAVTMKATLVSRTTSAPPIGVVLPKATASPT